jgi:hypothetical protein
MAGWLDWIGKNAKASSTKLKARADGLLEAASESAAFCPVSGGVFLR